MAVLHGWYRVLVVAGGKLFLYRNGIFVQPLAGVVTVAGRHVGALSLVACLC